ncbi:MAG: FHA domain-containing protein [Spirochaetales bacterium]|nr:FHA domain-containing protein [Spirochaetales bacterium]
MKVDAASALHSWFLESSLTDGNSVQIKLDHDPFVIGRDKKCHLTLSSAAVSRRHSEIYSNNSTVYIRDLESTNGTFINSKQIKEPEIIHDGDYIAFADQQFQLIYKGTSIQDDRDSKTNFLKNPQRYRSFAEMHKLSNREEEIFFLLMQGKSTREISETLFITFGTAKNHILNIFSKTGVHSKFQLLTEYNKFDSAKK